MNKFDEFQERAATLLLTFAVWYLIPAGVIAYLIVR